MKTVILAARWSLYLEGSRFDNQEGGVESAHPALHISVIRDGRTLTAGGDAEQAALVAEQYQQSVAELLQMGKQVILVYPIPEAGWHVPDYLSKLTLFGHNIEAATGSTDHTVFTARNARTQAALDAIGEHPNLFRIFPE